MKATKMYFLLQAAEAAAKQAKQDDRSRSKAGSSSAKRGKSQSPGRKKGKRDDAPPSPKKDTKLKRRGELEDTFKTIGKYQTSMLFIHSALDVYV